MKELAGADDDGPSLLATIKAVPGCGLLMPTPRAGVLVGYGRVSTREQTSPAQIRPHHSRPGRCCRSSTVLDRVPLGMLPEPAPSGSCSAQPRRSVISSFSAASRTVLVNCLSSPAGPVRDSP